MPDHDARFIVSNMLHATPHISNLCLINHDDTKLITSHPTLSLRPINPLPLRPLHILSDPLHSTNF